MELTSVQCFLKGKTILVTGATGFLAKVFVEKLLRIQSDIKKLYLLIRASNTDEATQRLHDEMIRKELFRVLREKWGEEFDSLISEKVVAVAGDVCVANLGLKDENLRSLILKETDVIVNCAATTNFDERFDIAMGTNTMGPLHVLNFAKSCPKLQIFLHISTGYVCGEAKDNKEVIVERAFKMGETLKAATASRKLDIASEKKLMDERLQVLLSQNADGPTAINISSAMKDYGLERARMYGWPNTYVFTKAMGEMLLSHFKDNIPLIIIRPTMVTSTYKEPFPGWIEGYRTLDSVIGGYGKGTVKSFLGDPTTTLDVIPADMVINCMMAAMVSHSIINNEASSENYIYHVSSSSRNPFTISDLCHISYLYFTKNPLINKRSGKPVITYKVKMITNMPAFRTHMMIRYELPLKGLNLVSKMLCGSCQDVCSRSHRKIKSVKRMAQLYKSYVFFKGVFDDTNTEKLRMGRERWMKEEDEYEIEFNPKSIDWRDYMMNVHIHSLG